MLVVVSILLILFSSLRDGSPDQDDYRSIFHQVATFSNVLNGDDNYSEIYGEWGYLLLLSVIKEFSEVDMIMFFIMALLSVGIVTYSCRCISPYPLLSMLCYFSWFYYSSFGALRHSIASSLVLLLIVALVKNKRKIALCISLCAISIHSSALSLVAVWFSKVISKHRFILVGLTLASITIGLAGGIATEAANYVLPYTNEYIQKKLILYMQSDVWGGNISLGGGTVIKQLCVIILCYYFRDILNKKFIAFPTVFGTYIISLSVLLLFNDFKLLGDRVSNLLIISEIILIPMLFSLIATREKILASFVLLVPLYIQFNILVGEQYYPYKSVF